MHFSKLYKIKEGKISTLKKWFSVLENQRVDEAIATFASENITRETFVLFSLGKNKYFLLGLNEANGNPKKSDPELVINKEHQKILSECLEPVSEKGEIILDIRL